MFTKNILLYCLFIFPFVAIPLKAQEINLTVTGIGTSEANAIVDAQRNALRTSYGEYISTNLTVLNNELTKNETVNLVSGTINDFKVLSVSANDFSDPPIIEVLIQVTINKGQLISFAKAIGDSVEIQGSIYGAEIQLQEINKNNEAIAMKHLEKKAKFISSLFDYEIEVQDPKMSQLLANDFYIYSSVRLKTNKNFISLMSTIQKTVSSIAMDINEINKNKELNVPYYYLDILRVIQPNCEKILDGSQSSYDWNGDSPDNKNRYPGNLEFTKIFTRDELRKINIVKFKKIEKVKWWEIQKEELTPKVKGIKVFGPIRDRNSREGYKVTCTHAEVDKFYLRSKESLKVLDRINNIINTSVLNYRLYRKKLDDKKLLFPFPLSSKQFEPGITDQKHHGPRYNWDRSLRDVGYEDHSRGWKNKELMTHQLGDLVFTEMFFDSLPEESLVSEGDPSFNFNVPSGCNKPGQQQWAVCFKSRNFPVEVEDLSRMYSGSGYGPWRKSKYSNDLSYGIIGARISKGYFWDSITWEEPKFKNLKNWDGSMRTKFLGKEFQNSLIYDFVTGHSFQILMIYPINFNYVTLVYEDIIEKDELSKLTGYSVELNK